MSALPNVVACSCGAVCDWEDEKEGEPCYGAVSAIEEVWSADDYGWVHGCEGHKNMYEDGKYVPYQG